MKHILLIDDDEDMLAMTGRWLEKDGYAVSRASSGEKALELLKEISPDLILLDYAMPEMDGPAVLEAVRADDKFKDVPVYLRTGMEYTSEGGLEGAEKASGIIPKAQGKPHLLKIVREAL